ncbi:hypothetical protein AB0D14_38450 [Streptomyces sp. NPDC048484]|uniref:hypothetical protein n=1 Tax=Streptomyces sp. NPDC048484 TaxID=3155146 RepID=UPI00341B336D
MIAHRPDEIRSPKELAPGAVDVSDDEIEGARALIDHMSCDSLEGSEFEDHYTDALAEVIKAKREGTAPPQMPEQEASAGKVVDLMAALEASVKKAKSSCGEDDAAVHELPKKKATSKSTAKKTPAKTTTKKTAKKTATRKRSA